MPNKNGEWWNGGWQRRGKSEWNLENESVFRENDDISVSLVQKLRGFWVDGEPPKKTMWIIHQTFCQQLCKRK